MIPISRFYRVDGRGRRLVRHAAESVGLARPSGSRTATGGEELVNELDRHRAFADGRGDSLRRLPADVAGHKDSGYAGLEEEGITLEWPRAALTVALEHVGPGEEVAALVETQPALEAGGERLAPR